MKSLKNGSYIDDGEAADEFATGLTAVLFIVIIVASAMALLIEYVIRHT